MVNGLILAGGRSTRMGRDKSVLTYGEKTQREVLFELLKPVCEAVFLSVNAEQTAESGSRFPILVDDVADGGPLGGLLSAFARFPDVAWLTVPCDWPFLTEQTLRFLVENRDAAKLATAFAGTDGLPEPLLAIWEPAALPTLRKAFENGHGPRRVLLQHPVALLPAPDLAEFQNVNTPEAYARLAHHLPGQ